MVKFKFLSKPFKRIKCLLRKTFMARSSNETVPPTASRKKEVNHKRFMTKASVVSSSSAEGFIPLAARDSQWIGIEFYNKHFRSPLDEQDDAEEIELQNLAADGIDAILLLFPGLNKNSNALLKDEHSSTTEITRLLVGQKADFRNLKGSKKLLPADNKLTSVPEVPQEDKMQSETDVSTCNTRKQIVTNVESTDVCVVPEVPQEDKMQSETDVSTCNTRKQIVTNVESTGVCADDEDDEPVLENRIKKRKKKSEVRVIPMGASSVSVFPPQRKPSSRVKHPPLPQQSLVVSHSSTDDEKVENKNK